MSEHASAWGSLVDEWVERENALHPDAPIDRSTIRVRDNVEIGDQMFVLVSYDVEYPWPDDEDTSIEGRHANTAVLQAARVRQPWIERDVTRAHACLSDEAGSIVLHEHVLGRQRVFSGQVAAGGTRATLKFADGTGHDAAIVDGWFLVVAEGAPRAESAAIDGNDPITLHRDEPELVVPTSFARTADRTMYFSPLDLRGVLPIQHWERHEGVVVVATAVEHYDEGGILRLRIDGIRVDDDALVSWPKVRLRADGNPVASGVCGEYAMGDTLSLDIGFRPWIGESSTLGISVEGLRGPAGAVPAITFEVSLSRSR